jgi:channel protein (hemolysin III family)
MGVRDPVSSVTHLLAAGWAAYATLVLVRLTPPAGGRRTAVAVYGASMILLYLASGVFHAVPFTRADHPAEYGFFQAADRSAIFALIAGTNTPVIVALLSGRWRRWCLIAMWSVALIGVASLWLLPQAPYAVTVTLYLVMGWLGGVPVVHYYRAVGWRAMNWVLAGAALYTAGAVCDLLRWPVLTEAPVRVGPHEVFHLAVVGASTTFFVFVARHVILHEPTPRN